MNSINCSWSCYIFSPYWCSYLWTFSCFAFYTLVSHTNVSISIEKKNGQSYFLTLWCRENWISELSSFNGISYMMCAPAKPGRDMEKYINLVFRVIYRKHCVNIMFQSPYVTDMTTDETPEPHLTLVQPSLRH